MVLLSSLLVVGAAWGGLPVWALGFLFVTWLPDFILIAGVVDTITQLQQERGG